MAPFPVSGPTVTKPRAQPASPKSTEQQPHPGQWRHAAALWRDYLADASLPQLDRWLKQRLARSKQFGKRDRMIYADLLFNGVRFGYWAAFVLQLDNTRHPDGDTLQAFAHRYDSTEALRRHLADLTATTSVADSRGAADVAFLTLCHWRANPAQPLPDPLSALGPNIEYLQQQASLHPGSVWSLLWHGIPLAHHEAVCQRINVSHWSDQQVLDFLQAQDQRPPLWLRINHEEERAAVLQELHAHYKVTELQQGIAIDGDKGVFNLDCYRNGAMAIQDLASQQLAARVACQPGDKVWDACAGGGGKTLAIAARLANRGSVWASDIRTHKLEEIKRRASLSRFYNIRTAAWNGEAALEPPKEIARQGGFNWVLVDAPCSSSGTWRRNPDAKLRDVGSDLKVLTTLQLQLLQHASQNVRTGGHLVYGTCSFRCDENEEIIARFLLEEQLQHNRRWELIEQTLLGCPEQDSDTMFVAVMQRLPAANS
jgi:16S rRNA (cytosine967-C5)-methyltransferase